MSDVVMFRLVAVILIAGAYGMLFTGRDVSEVLFMVVMATMAFGAAIGARISK